MLFDMFLICPYYLDMSESDSSSNFSISSISDNDIAYSELLNENLIFYLICQEPSLFKSTRKFCGVKERKSSISFINSWTDIMFVDNFEQTVKTLQIF